MNKIKFLTLVLVVSQLTACSYFYSEDGWFKDTSNDYVKAKQEKEIVLPDGLTQKNKLDFAPVPAIGENAKNAPVNDGVLTAAPVQILAVQDNVRVDRVSDEPSVFIVDEFPFVWSSLQSWLTQNEIVPELNDEQNYVLETGWLAVDERGVWLGVENNEEIDDFRARYKLWLTKADIAGELRLSISRLEAQKINDDSDEWETIPTYWEDSAQMLNFVLLAYADSSGAREEERIRLANEGFSVELGADSENQAALVADKTLEDVWDRLPNALKRAGFSITDKDRSSRIYYLKLEKEEDGFFASLFSSEKVQPLLDDGDYQVVISELGERTAITFNDGQGNALSSELVVKNYPVLSQAFNSKKD